MKINYQPLEKALEDARFAMLGINGVATDIAIPTTILDANKRFFSNFAARYNLAISTIQEDVDIIHLSDLSNSKNKKGAAIKVSNLKNFDVYEA